MKLLCNITCILAFTFSSVAFSQSTQDVSTLLDSIMTVKNSKDIAKTFAPAIAPYNKKTLPVLATFFADSTATNVYSDCLERKLSRGELAIIVADLNESMPYYKVTGVQNCILEFCEGNPNLIEYYLDFIKSRGTAVFIEKYTSWITSREGKKHQGFSVQIITEEREKQKRKP
jgi:hypothetical protein